MWLAGDQQPDATACRLRISLATEASPFMVCPWQLATELEAYARYRSDAISYELL